MKSEDLFRIKVIEQSQCEVFMATRMEDPMQRKNR
jgi:hypothetical protein